MDCLPMTRARTHFDTPAPATTTLFSGSSVPHDLHSPSGGPTMDENRPRDQMQTLTGLNKTAPIVFTDTYRCARDRQQGAARKNKT